jgi:hypothetical protein
MIFQPVHEHDCGHVHRGFIHFHLRIHSSYFYFLKMQYAGRKFPSVLQQAIRVIDSPFSHDVKRWTSRLPLVATTLAVSPFIGTCYCTAHFKSSAFTAHLTVVEIIERKVFSMLYHLITEKYRGNTREQAH